MTMISPIIRVGSFMCLLFAVEGMLDFSTETTMVTHPSKPSLPRKRDYTVPNQNTNIYEGDDEDRVKVADDFGKIVDSNLIIDVDWQRILTHHSYYQSQCNLEVQLDCYLASDPSLSCRDYMDTLAKGTATTCQANVVYEVSVTNNGSITDTVDTVKIAIDNERPFTPIFDGSFILAPGETLTSDMSRSLNFCSSYQTGVSAEVVVTCPEGEPVMSTRSYAFNSIRSPTCNAVLGVRCEAADGGPCRPAANTDLCTFRPLYFDFLFSGGLCDQSDNSQRNHFRCVDDGDVTALSEVFVIVQGTKSHQIYFSDLVSKDEVFTIGTGRKVDSEMRVMIFPHNPSHGGSVTLPVQTFRFHSSCSKDIFLNDVFGAITIAGFRDQYNDITSDLIGSLPEYKFTYKIDNRGDDHILFRDLTFSADNNEDFTIVPSHQRPILARDSLYGNALVQFNITTQCFEAKARLVYETLPSFNSKTCVAEAKFNEAISGKGGKGRTSKKGGKRSNSCQAKSKSPSSNKGGKGSGASSKKGKGSKKGSKGAPYGHPSKGSYGKKGSWSKGNSGGKGKGGKSQPSKGRGKGYSKGTKGTKGNSSNGIGKGSYHGTKGTKGTKGSKGEMNQWHPSKGKAKGAKAKGYNKGTKGGKSNKSQSVIAPAPNTVSGKGYTSKKNGGVHAKSTKAKSSKSKASKTDKKGHK